MRYEYRASGKIGIDGVIVEDGTLVATVETDFPMGNVMACIRLSQFTVTEVPAPEAKLMPTPPPPPPNETTTKGVVPPSKVKPHRRK